jgi:hypothetical protein
LVEVLVTILCLENCEELEESVLREKLVIGSICLGRRQLVLQDVGAEYRLEVLLIIHTEHCQREFVGSQILQHFHRKKVYGCLSGDRRIRIFNVDYVYGRRIAIRPNQNEVMHNKHFLSHFKQRKKLQIGPDLPNE